MTRVSCGIFWRSALAGAVLLLVVGPTEGQTVHSWQRPPGPEAPFDLTQRQVMTAQLGMEDWQRGYLAKVQGASSQNVLWITPSDWPGEEPRLLLKLFKRRR